MPLPWVFKGFVFVLSANAVGFLGACRRLKNPQGCPGQGRVIPRKGSEIRDDAVGGIEGDGPAAHGSIDRAISDDVSHFRAPFLDFEFLS